MTTNFLIIICTILAAADVRLEVQHETNSDGLTRQEARAVFEAAVSQIKAETGVAIKLTRWTTKRVKRRRYSDFYSVPFLPRYDPTKRLFAIKPRYYVGPGDPYTGGKAWTCGRQGGVAVGRLTRFPGYELEHARTAIVHELGHMIGAKHQDDVSVMNTGALGLLEAAGFYLPFNEQSIKEIGRCQRPWG